jgi:dihydrofolate reductase
VKISAIAAVGDNWELGKENSLIWKSEKDLAHFKQYTMGKALIVGAKTYLSMPALSGRKVICVAGDFSERPIEAKQTGDVFVSEFEYNNNFIPQIIKESQGKEIVLIGGEETYKVFAPFVTELVLTRIPFSNADADTHFPKDSYKELLGRTANTRALTDILTIQTYSL